LNGRIISDDVIRIECSEADTAGYLYAFLSTKTGRALVKSNEYGAMIPHIEPSHLESVPVPNPPPILKKQIHDLVIHSYALRDESNALLDEAERLLYDALKLPPLSKLHPQAFDKTAELRNYAVNLSQLAGRFDASYHFPIIDAIMRRLNKEAAEITTIGDPRISERVFLPGRFARVYVQEGQGAVYFTGKHMLELDPEAKRHLAFAKHTTRIRNQLSIRENMLLFSCSGNLGKVVLSPKHWDGWVMTHDIIRLVPTNRDMAGFLAVYLNTDYGQELIRRNSYGAVVPHIDDHHVAQVPVPLLKDSSVQAEINHLAIEANAKRTEAYHAEQKAIRITNEEVIHAAKA
jgi:type I restriction enzyme S subunit